MSDHLDFLDETQDKPVVVETTDPQSQAAVQPTTEIAEVPVPEAVVEDTSAETAPEGEARMVPLATYLDMRDKLKTAEKRVKELEPAEEVQAPDPKTDPKGYAEYVREVEQFDRLNERLNFSEELSKVKHGEELTAKVREWALVKFETDAEFTNRVMSNANPYEAAIREMKAEERSKALEGVDPTEMEAFQAWKASQQNGDTPSKVNTQAPANPVPKVQTAVPATPKKAAVIPKSINDAPSGGKGTQAIAIGDGTAFDSIFQK